MTALTLGLPPAALPSPAAAAPQPTQTAGEFVLPAAPRAVPRATQILNAGNIRRTLIRRDPEQHGDNVAAQFEAAARASLEAGQLSQAEDLLGKAVAIRQLVLDLCGQPADRCALASTLAQYAGVLSRMGHQREALPHLYTALELTREAQPHTEPDQHALAVATCHYNLADTLPWTGAFDEALLEVAASEQSLAPLADANPDLYAREMADCAQLRAEIVRAAEHGLPERRHP